jgi:hypothetical protein
VSPPVNNDSIPAYIQEIDGEEDSNKHNQEGAIVASSSPKQIIYGNVLIG